MADFLQVVIDRPQLRSESDQCEQLAFLLRSLKLLVSKIPAGGAISMSHARRGHDSRRPWMGSQSRRRPGTPIRNRPKDSCHAAALDGAALSVRPVADSGAITCRSVSASIA
jgi:hypothetical protein